MGKSCADGELSRKFFKFYEEIQNSEASNIGWTMINEKFPASNLMRYSTIIDPVIFKIKFLEPQYLDDEKEEDV
jgi:hypothetical protein